MRSDNYSENDIFGDLTLIMASNYKSLAQKIGHIFDPINSFDNLTNPPSEKEVVCRFIAIFDAERTSYHNSTSAEYSVFPILAKELIEFWKKHNIFKTENAVETKLRRTLIPKMKLILRKIPKTDALINKTLEKFSNTFEINQSSGPSPAKKIREESPQNDDDDVNFGKTQL